MWELIELLITASTLNSAVMTTVAALAQQYCEAEADNHPCAGRRRGGPRDTTSRSSTTLLE